MGNKRRGRPLSRLGAAAHPAAKEAVPRSGAALLLRISEMSEDSCTEWPVGTAVVAKVQGWKVQWPAAVWSVGLCLRMDMEQLLESYRSGRVLLRFYGERTLLWAREDSIERGALTEQHISQLWAWGRAHRKPKLIEAVLKELEGAQQDPCAEAARLQRLQRALSGTRFRSVCGLCAEEGAVLHCAQCQRSLHTLCLDAPCLSVADLGAEGIWECPSCGQPNSSQSDMDIDPEEKEAAKAERMGLTPDWIIQVASFAVFQLERPSPAQPYIKGLLDPCTNSLAAPNIPAEKNGLLMSNSWSGFHVLLNPDYSAATQWRFVNRAIDEVENDRVPAVLLVARNSTDTAYFQRLRPYPRVLLRRSHTRFKDYDKTPIGFGVVLFCIAKASCKDMYERFYDGFAAMGEPNIPIDRAFMASPGFYELLSRLKRHAEENQRDHWIQCSACARWRIITYDTLLALRDDTVWTCASLRPPHSTCKTPQSKRELAGARGYAAMTTGSLATAPPAALAALHIPAALQLPSTPAAQLLTALPCSAAPQLGGLEEGLLQAKIGSASDAQASTPAAAGEDDGEGSSAKAGAASEELAAVSERSADAGMAGQAGRVALVSRQESCASIDLADVAVAAAAAPALQSCPAAGSVALPIAALRAETPPANAQPPVCTTSLAVAEAGPAANEDDADWQVLTAIELARNARIAANKAYWASLAAAGGRGCTGGSVGSSPALPVDHPLVLTAARDLARKAALQQATLQVDAAQRRWISQHQRLDVEAAKLTAALTALHEDEQCAADELLAARSTLQEVLAEQQLDDPSADCPSIGEQPVAPAAVGI